MSEKGLSGNTLATAGLVGMLLALAGTGEEGLIPPPGTPAPVPVEAVQAAAAAGGSNPLVVFAVTVVVWFAISSWRWAMQGRNPSAAPSLPDGTKFTAAGVAWQVAPLLVAAAAVAAVAAAGWAVTVARWELVPLTVAGFYAVLILRFRHRARRRNDIYADVQAYGSQALGWPTLKDPGRNSDVPGWNDAAPFPTVIFDSWDRPAVVAAPIHPGFHPNQADEAEAALKARLGGDWDATWNWTSGSSPTRWQRWAGARRPHPAVTLTSRDTLVRVPVARG